MNRLLKILPATVLAATGAAAIAYAADSDKPSDSRLEKAFGSTIVSTYPDGRQAELWLKRDGSYTAEGRRHDRSSGTWQVKDDKLCMKQHSPIPAPFSYCTAVPEGGIDKPWTGKAYTGEQTTIKLMKGIFDPAKGGGEGKSDRKAQAQRPDGEG